MTKDNGNTPKRKRRTREEMIAATRAKLAKLEAQADGSYDAGDKPILSRLRARLRKTNTELSAARIAVDGVAKPDGSGWSRRPIDEMIENTERRLNQQRATRDRSNLLVAELPNDIARLETLIELAESGDENVEFPTDLTRLGSESDRTDEQHEAHAILSNENGDN